MISQQVQKRILFMSQHDNQTGLFLTNANFIKRQQIISVLQKTDVIICVDGTKRNPSLLLPKPLHNKDWIQLELVRANGDFQIHDFYIRVFQDHNGTRKLLQIPFFNVFAIQAKDVIHSNTNGFFYVDSFPKSFHDSFVSEWQNKYTTKKLSDWFPLFLFVSFAVFVWSIIL